MDLYNKNKVKYYPNRPRPEIEVKFENEKGKLIINVHKNITLIKEKKKFMMRNKKYIMYKNVLVMFLDTKLKSCLLWNHSLWKGNSFRRFFQKGVKARVDESTAR